MAWYRNGTVTVANGSPVVTGAGTDFVSNTSVGEAFLGPDGRVYEITQIVSATQIVLGANYQGAGAGGQGYAILPTQSFVRDLALGAATLLNSFASVRDGVGAGLFPDGLPATPGLRFAADQDTGITRVGENAIAIVTGGAIRAQFDASGQVFYGGGVERARFDATGNLLIGATSGSTNTVRKAAAVGSPVLSVQSGTGFQVANFNVSDGTGADGANAANASLKLGSAGTGRSLAAAGTINASGADYAEYMTKAPGCGTIAKGDVCGVDRQGLITRTWADAIMFKIKSTDPNLVGGDTWSAHLGPRPEQPVRGDATEAAFASAMARYDADIAAFEAALEKVRLTVDRIAYCGRVPVNFAGACEPGDYLVAIANGGGIGLKAVAEADITFADYRRRVGRVLSIGADGRPIVDVMQG